MAKKSLKTKLEEIIKMAKENGLKSIKCDGIELEFNDYDNDNARTIEPAGEPLPEEKMPTDDELLYHSVDYIPPVRVEGPPQ